MNVVPTRCSAQYCLCEQALCSFKKLTCRWEKSSSLKTAVDLLYLEASS